MTVVAEPDKPHVEQPAAEAAKPLSERLSPMIDDFLSQAGAEEPAAAQKPEAEGAQTPPAGAEAKPDESPAAVSWVPPTAEQLRDKTWWGGLSKEGWEQAESAHPVEAAHVKASQAAGTKIVNDARAEADRILSEARASATPAERLTEQPKSKPSPELIAAVEKSQSIDIEEAAEGHLAIARLASPIVAKEIGVDPNRNRSEAELASAINAAAKEVPELAAFVRNDTDRQALDDIADSSPALKALIATGAASNIAVALAEAARIHIGRKTDAAAKAKTEADKAEADRKQKELQKVIQSNARPASAVIVAQHGAMQPSKVPFRERAGAIVDDFLKQS